jgi:hypothetical protein
MIHLDFVHFVVCCIYSVCICVMSITCLPLLLLLLITNNIIKKLKPCQFVVMRYFYSSTRTQMGKLKQLCLNRTLTGVPTFITSIVM